jgi:hypothetical protein
MPMSGPRPLPSLGRKSFFGDIRLRGRNVITFDGSKIS